MAYTPNPTWVDGVDGGTRIDAANLNHIEAGIEAAHALLDAQPLNAQTGTTYTIASADAGKLLTCTNANPITVTLPASVLATGQRVDIAALGAGMVTLAGSGGMTLTTPETLTTRTTGSVVSVVALSGTTALVVGDTEVAA